MQKFSYVLTDGEGIHARPAGELVKLIKTLQSEVTVTANGKSVSGRKVLAMMSLGAKKGQEVEFAVEGPDEAEAAKTIEDFMKANL